MAGKKVMSMRVGITGQAGFIGTHLFNHLGLERDIERVEFKDEFFQDETALRNFVKHCDVIVHLAAMNRHPDIIFYSRRKR
jgi:UDP-2-acetamido-2,6-beta-L-arabino-hexul-4-ose reductase